MLHVYKRSSTALPVLDVIRTAGPNTIAPDLAAKFLLLWNAEAVQDDDGWHYVFDFDVRDSLQFNDLAKLMGAQNGRGQYKDGTDWKAWLGEGWERIDEKRRWEILHPHGQDAPRTGVVISDLRIGPNAGKPMPPR